MNKFIIGLILGIAIAGGLVFYLNNVPNQFVTKVDNTPQVISNSSGPTIFAPGTKLREASGQAVTNASAPNYDFYEILQGKKVKSSQANVENKAQNVKYYIQASAFTDSDLANDMKARLALLGYDTVIKSQLNDGVVTNRIIIGPFSTVYNANQVIDQLADNNIKAILIKDNN